MRNFTIYLTGILLLFLTQIFAQETFESRAKVIASKIESITKEEKAALKEEVEAVNIQLEKKKITQEQADQKKQELASTRAKNIETRVALVQDELKDLVQEKVDGKIKEQDSSRTWVFHFDNKKHKQKNLDGERRTTSQFVFAFGLNNLATDKSIAHSDYRFWGSHFYEWGFTYNTRILKNDNLLHAKYGLSLMYNNLRPTENRYFKETGNQTNLEVSATHLNDSRFRNVYVVLPAHLEFDFTKKKQKDDKTIFRTHKSFRVGLGGYVGANIKSKQILKYEDEDGNNVKQKTKGDFNVNDFIYGASAYIGYREVSLYAKYDISPLFANNAVDQNNVSFGLRFDFN
ncbi:hypothetical protein [Flavobacterium sp.]|uniref:hypothetical protein n=1 Tax=Flavobacterium sp. TaxID=239 RepID=UPI00286BAFE8|nr:hypothetical protein [Flavobacterium sp.]